MILPRRVMVLMVVIFIVDVVILDTAIPFAKIVLPVMVEYAMESTTIVDVISVEYNSVLP